jgi:hypothetical protein
MVLTAFGAIFPRQADTGAVPFERRAEEIEVSWPPGDDG